MVVGMTTMVILVSCPDQPGIVARITGRLYAAGANILTLEQHVEEGQLFFMRIVADVSRVADTTEMREGLQGLAAELAADLLVKDADERQRLAILVSRDGACLEDLLSKQRAGEINCEIPLVIGNTEALRGIAEISGIPFYCVPSQPGVGGPHEQRLLELMAAARVDAIVLARYMKVLSREFVAEYENRMINIHHGFLPAFKGARPYHEAWERGVKVIGATAHFVTAELDDGPIIAQGVTAVTHQSSVETMIKTGREVERRVLGEAVRAYLEHRIVAHKRRTIVFN
jgi:formyltetrahydrofolate deformylase